MRGQSSITERLQQLQKLSAFIAKTVNNLVNNYKLADAQLKKIQENSNYLSQEARAFLEKNSASVAGDSSWPAELKALSSEVGLRNLVHFFKGTYIHTANFGMPREEMLNSKVSSNQLNSSAGHYDEGLTVKDVMGLSDYQYVKMLNGYADLDDPVDRHLIETELYEGEKKLRQMGSAKKEVSLSYEIQRRVYKTYTESIKYRNLWIEHALKILYLVWKCCHDLLKSCMDYRSDVGMSDEGKHPLSNQTEQSSQGLANSSKIEDKNSQSSLESFMVSICESMKKLWGIVPRTLDDIIERQYQQIPKEQRYQQIPKDKESLVALLKSDQYLINYSSDPSGCESHKSIAETNLDRVEELKESYDRFFDSLLERTDNLQSITDCKDHILLIGSKNYLDALYKGMDETVERFKAFDAKKTYEVIEAMIKPASAENARPFSF